MVSDWCFLIFRSKSPNQTGGSFCINSLTQSKKACGVSSRKSMTLQFYSRPGLLNIPRLSQIGCGAAAGLVHLIVVRTKYSVSLCLLVGSHLVEAKMPGLRTASARTLSHKRTCPCSQSLSASRMAYPPVNRPTICFPIQASVA